MSSSVRRFLVADAIPRSSERLRLKKTRAEAAELQVPIANTIANAGSKIPAIIMPFEPRRRPSKIPSLHAFHLFGDSPVELQIEIWKHAMAENTIEIQWKYFWSSHLQLDALQVDRAFMRSMVCRPNTVFSGLFSFFMPQRRYLLRTCRLSRVVARGALKKEVAAMPVSRHYANIPAALTWAEAEIIAILQFLIDSLENPGAELKRELAADHEKRSDGKRSLPCGCRE